MLSLILLELTLREIVADLPRDAGTVVVLALLLALVGFVWHGSRGSAAAPAPLPPVEPDAALPAPPAVAEPQPEPVLFHLSALSTTPDVRSLHAEVK